MKGNDKMKINELKELMTMIEQSSIDVLKLEKKDFKLYYQKENSANLGIDFEEEHSQGIIANTKETRSKAERASSVNDEVFHQIKSTMIGAFYACPNFDSEPFVQIGSIIKKNQPICILEAMKLLNEVQSDVDGEIVEILVKDGDIIEFGQPLFAVKVSD